jgi:hypothetical protein
VVVGGNQPGFIFDGDFGKASGINRIGGKYFGENAANYKGKVFSDSGENRVLIYVRKGSLKATVNGKSIVDWSGDASTLSFAPRDELPEKSVIGLAAWESGFAISKFALTPVTGVGKTIRIDLSAK